VVGQETGFLDPRFDSLPAPEARLSAPLSQAMVAATTSTCVLPARDVTLAGHCLGATDRKALFAPNLHQTIACGDERYPHRGHTQRGRVRMKLQIHARFSVSHLVRALLPDGGGCAPPQTCRRTRPTYAG
jgi:hypothetical protein